MISRSRADGVTRMTWVQEQELRRLAQEANKQGGDRAQVFEADLYTLHR